MHFWCQTNQTCHTCQTVPVGRSFADADAPIFGADFLPLNFNHTLSLDAFAGYYVNHFTDHHMHKIVF
ncbi:hypothetical protein BYT27DRAFT_7088414 [Phlegmacium glaucopus]|nr:hypothetical protein BYT27DRAFT_7088414 [Phlegmacium glaucopus]